MYNFEFGTKSSTKPVTVAIPTLCCNKLILIFISNKVNVHVVDMIYYYDLSVYLYTLLNIVKTLRNSLGCVCIYI